MIISQTPRLTIREFLPAEEGLFIQLLSDPRLTDYIPKRNNDENRKIFQDTLIEYQQGNKLTRWGVFDRGTSEFIGFAMLKGIDSEPKMGELGYVIHDKFKNSGMATELSVGMINYGFKEQNLSVVYAVTDQENIPSKRVLLKAGMKEGEMIMRNGAWLSYYKILAKDWPA